MPKQNKKSTKKTYGVRFGFSNLFWALKLPWSVVDIPSNTLLGGKTDFFSFTSRYQLTIASWLGMRLCIHVPLSVWEFCLPWICLVGMASRYEFICVSLTLCLEDTAGSHPPFKGFTILAEQSLFLYYIVFFVESCNLSKCWLEVDPGCSALNRTLQTSQGSMNSIEEGIEKNVRGGGGETTVKFGYLCKSCTRKSHSSIQNWWRRNPWGPIQRRGVIDHNPYWP